MSAANLSTYLFFLSLIFQACSKKDTPNPSVCQLTSDGGTIFSYDKNGVWTGGAITGGGSPISYIVKYDSDNRISQISHINGYVTYQYDANNRVIADQYFSLHQYVGLVAQESYIYNSNGQLFQYIFEDVLNEVTAGTWITRDTFHYPDDISSNFSSMDQNIIEGNQTFEYSATFKYDTHKNAYGALEFFQDSWFFHHYYPFLFAKNNITQIITNNPNVGSPTADYVLTYNEAGYPLTSTPSFTIYYPTQFAYQNCK